ncbi:MAG TPA: 50S ribosomal protein L4 [Acidobacteriota bacterium]|nr:50S ribosomal protein L4 [Acidobacteriota bacterium]HMZ80724.1 50S ribosomal protein L4 [Acidobacteriota bacterium]HNB69852.1 50S ribosomal protein L4 [Acidobacteriota bacterium]HNC46329.1 50S ribosomal protein L4 [Acidobacteriota bacterium]HND19462.1 50S ribosomal protein L4 [Acidobacteriota bacterium]
MPVVKVRNLKNEEVGEIELSERVFGAPLNKALIYEAVKEFRARGRAGTVATKTRGDVSGAGRKLWKQKGTGRARIASLRSPLWKGGGNVHGPQPRDWSYQIPKKMRRGAIRAALSERLREGGVIVVDDFSLQQHKTRDLVAILSKLGVDKRALLVDSLENRNLILASRNLPDVDHTNSFGLNIFNVLLHEQIVLSKRAVGEIEKILA